MSSLKTLVLAGAVAAAAMTQAHAADLGAPAPMLAPPPMPIAEASGWYLRGDVGVGMTGDNSWSQDLSASERTSVITSRGFPQKEIGDSAFVGIGAGYKVNNWLRGDITVDYHAGRSINGILQSQGTFGTAGGPVAFTGQNVYGGGRISSVVALVNGYVDLGSWYGITPYVGAGAGMAYHRVRGLAETGGIASIPALGVFGPVGASTIGNATRTNFAWALMAGVAYDVTQNLKLDLGYRYLNMGEARTGLVNCNPALCNAGPAPGLRFKDLSSHDFHVGLRWMLAADAPQVFAPLVRKY